MMVDIEAIGTNEDGILLSVGLVVFNFDTNEIKRTYHWKLEIDEQSKKGRTVNLDTLQWWLKQSEEAREEFWGERVSVEKFIKEFQDACKNVSFGWAKGVQFDFPMLEHLFKLYDAKFPINRSKYLDARVVYFLAKKAKTMNPLTEPWVAHNPLDDSLRQCKVVFDYMERIRDDRNKAERYENIKQ